MQFILKVVQNFADVYLSSPFSALAIRVKLPLHPDGTTRD